MRRTFEELFIHELEDIYDAERRIQKALPRMIEAATSRELRAALEQHGAETDGHVARLEEGFRLLGESPRGRTCEAMKGLLKEGEDLTHESEDPSVNDAALIAAAQKIEHYEIATYGTLREWARQLGYDALAASLQKSLAEESEADRKLSTISESLNSVAANGHRKP